jgi:predicted nucleic-acid-binding Zn-ribbon protein
MIECSNKEIEFTSIKITDQTEKMFKIMENEYFSEKNETKMNFID